MDELTRAVTRFRAAMESGVLANFVQFAEFPRGSCGDTCLLLGRWLRERGFGDWDYVSGRHGHVTHAWLRHGTLIIDITADQFGDRDNAIFISSDDLWHRQFDGMVETLEAFGADDDLNEAYAILMLHLG
jgi:hypothetical protein